MASHAKKDTLGYTKFFQVLLQGNRYGFLCSSTLYISLTENKSFLDPHPLDCILHNIKNVCPPNPAQKPDQLPIIKGARENRIPTPTTMLHTPQIPYPHLICRAIENKEGKATSKGKSPHHLSFQKIFLRSSLTRKKSGC